MSRKIEKKISAEISYKKDPGYFPKIDKPFFDKHFYNIFKDYTIDKSIIEKEVTEDFCKNLLVKVESKRYQLLVSRYLASDTPYRGLLVYHGLGSGKTRTAVLTMNNNLDRDVVIMLPASLLSSPWKTTIKYLYLGRNKKVISQLIKEKKIKKSPFIHYISHNASNFRGQVLRIPDGFNNKLVIIEECHLFFKNVISGKAKQAIDVYNLLYKAKNVKVLCLSGTPIAGDPFEVVPLFNILHGPIISGPKGALREHDLFPIMRDEFNKYFVSHEYNSIKNEDIFKERITGLVSYFADLKDDNQFVIPKHNKMEVIECPMEDIQLSVYIKDRLKEEKMERIYKFKTSAFSRQALKKPERASKGTYKVNSRMTSNFAFPMMIENIFDEISRSSKTASKDSDKSIDWAQVEEKFPKLKGKVKSKLSGLDTSKKFKVADMKWKLFQILDISKIKSYKDLKRHSSKLVRLLDNVTDPNKKGIKKFIYSEWTVLGTRLIGHFLSQFKGYTEVLSKEDLSKGEDYKRFVIIDGDTSGKKMLTDLFNDREKNVDGKQIQIIIGSKVVSFGYSFLNTREIHIFDPQWLDITIEQVLGRPRRLCSHQDLRREDRKIDTYIYLSVVKSDQQGLLPRSDKGKSTDQVLYSLATSKTKFINTFLHSIREAAIDCNLNIFVNQYGNDPFSSELGPIICKKCTSASPQKQIIIPNISQHISLGPQCKTEESKTDLKNIDIKDGYVKAIHLGMKKDKYGSVYKFNQTDKVWDEVGYIKNGKIILGK